MKMSRRPLTLNEKACAERLKRIWLQKARGLNLTQAEAASRLGWRSQGTVGQYLNGTIPLNTDAKFKFAKLLEVLPSEIDPELVGYIPPSANRVNLDFAQNVELGPKIRGRVPLISWVQAGSFCEAIDLFEPGDAEDWIVCPTSHSDRSFALRVIGPSMLPKFSEGEIIIVDPDESPDPGRYVVAKKTGENAVTFKQLGQESGQMFLRALNPDWPEQIIRLTEEWHICGVVICKLEML